jgi:hypothetical protein
MEKNENVVVIENACGIRTTSACETTLMLAIESCLNRCLNSRKMDFPEAKGDSFCKILFNLESLSTGSEFDA